MPINQTALDRWLLTQALVWAVLIPAVAVWVEIEGPARPQFFVFGGVMLVSHIVLVRVLGAGRTVADGVTLVRGLALWICTFLAWSSGVISWGLWVGLCLAVLADLLDGWCARRFGASDAGAMLDMETDQATTLSLAFLLHMNGVGPWVYVLPGFRYAYLLLMRGLQIRAADPKPCDGDNRRAKVICALMMILLLAACAPFATPLLANIMAAVCVLLLAYSYSSDVRFLVVQRRVGQQR